MNNKNTYNWNAWFWRSWIYARSCFGSRTESSPNTRFAETSSFSRWTCNERAEYFDRSWFPLGSLTCGQDTRLSLGKIHRCFHTTTPLGVWQWSRRLNVASLASTSNWKTSYTDDIRQLIIDEMAQGQKWMWILVLRHTMKAYIYS